MSDLAIEAPATEPLAGDPRSAPLVSLRGIRCRRGGSVVADGVDLEIRGGEILALLGDNGAGKSSLIDVLSGWATPESGNVSVVGSIDHAPLALGSHRAALEAGVHTIPRHGTLAGNLSALQNILVGTQSLWRLRLSRPAARSRIRALLERLSLRIDLDQPVARLSAGDRKRIEVVRALLSEARVLVLDEPTAALTRQETEALFAALRTVTTEDGIAVVFSTHKVADAFAFADRIAVLRQGRTVAEGAVADLDRGTVATQMTGRIVTRAAPSFRPTGDTLIEFRSVDADGSDPRSDLRQVSFELRAGEILGIAGIAGNGQATLEAVVAGLTKPSAGQVLLFGRPLRRYDAAAFVRAGIGRIPGDRTGSGIIGDTTVIENLVIEDFHRPWFARWGLVRQREVAAHASDLIATYRLGWRPDEPASTLSPTDMQRLLVTRALDREPRLIVATDPTLGLDAAATADVHQRLGTAREAGAGILLVSEDIDELLMLADMIAVLHHGRLTVPQPSAAFDAVSLGHMMGGHGSLALDWTGWGDGT